MLLIHGGKSLLLLQLLQLQLLAVHVQLAVSPQATLGVDDSVQGMQHTSSSHSFMLPRRAVLT